jgi:hypothetical protein
VVIRGMEITTILPGMAVMAITAITLDTKTSFLPRISTFDSL